MATWRVTRNDATTTDLVRPDVVCPYPWASGLALMDPATTMPSEWYAADNVRSVNLQPLPATGTVTYTITPLTGPVVVVRTSDLEGMAIYGDRYVTISRATEKGRYVILAVRWDFVTSIVRT